jgi:hypothetical protein
MKVSEAISQANGLRDNTLSDEQKAAWLFNLDGEVSEIVGEDAATGTELYCKISDLLGNYFEAVTA